MSNRIPVALCAAILITLPFTASAQKKGEAEMWLTSADRSSLFARQAEPLHFTKFTPTSPVIEVDDTKHLQQMDGFGFALTGGSAQLLMKMSPGRRTALLKELFSSGDGSEENNSIGVSYLRVSIGSSDMNDSVFTYDDMPAGETDPQLKKFALGPDLANVVPVLKEILAINPNIDVLASPWSAPSWMKTNGKPKDGHLATEWYQAYAQYLVRYIQSMAAQGIVIHAITLQNEPLNPKNTPSMVMTASEQAAFLGQAVGPAFRDAGIKTDVILYDHNCDRPDYPLDILADPVASPYAKGSGFHLYLGTIDAMSKVHDARPDKDLYFTEQMVTQEDSTKPFAIAHSVSRLMIGAPRNWSRNVLLWNLAADPQFGPHTGDGGCPVCQGAITLDGDTVTRNLAFYTVAHAAKFVRPGSTRIASDISSPGTISNVAFSTPSHHTVLLVANPGSTSQTFTVRFHKKAFTSTLAAGDAATYVW